MKNNIIKLASVGILALNVVACQKPDFVERNDKNTLSDFYATIDGFGQQRLFNSRISNDTIYLNVDYHYPIDSDNEVDLSKILLRASIPADAMISPSLNGFINLSSPQQLTIKAGIGEEKKYVVVANKQGTTAISSAKITYYIDGKMEEIEAIISNDRVIFYAMPEVDLSNATLTYSINKHAKGSIVNGGSINLMNKGLPFVVTAPGGASKQYTLEALEPLKLNYGVGVNRKLFSKTAAELSFSANMETSCFVSGDFLIIVSRTNPSVFKAYNRFTGEYSHTLANPFGSRLVFQGVADEQGQFFLTTYTPIGSAFIVYKYKDAKDTNPTKVLEYTYTKPAVVTAADGNIGRRVNFVGDVNGDGYLIASISMSKYYLRWKLTAGVFSNATPEVVEYKDGAASLGYIAEFQPVSTEPAANILASTIQDLFYISGATYTNIGKFVPANGTVLNGAIAHQKFNNAEYLANVRFLWSYDMNRAQMSLYDISNKSNIGMPFTNATYKDFNIFESEHFYGGTNGNSTSDICFGTSDNGDRMQVYMLLTNGGVMAHEFTRYAQD